MGSMLDFELNGPCIELLLIIPNQYTNLPLFSPIAWTHITKKKNNPIILQRNKSPIKKQGFDPVTDNDSLSSHYKIASKKWKTDHCQSFKNLHENSLNFSALYLSSAIFFKYDFTISTRYLNIIRRKGRTLLINFMKHN